jgi:small-conductance mechanosensitive channel
VFINKLLVLCVLLSVFAVPISAFVANSTSYEVGDFIQSTTGGLANSTNYDLRHTQHYQQPVAEFSDTNLLGALRWLPSFLNPLLFPNLIYVFEYCSSNSTLTTEWISSYMGVNTTTNLVLSPCSLGCSNETQTCVDLTQATDYSYISIFVLIASMVFLLISFYISKSKIIRILFGILIALLLIVILSLAIGPSTLTDNAIIQQIGGTNVNIYFVISLIVVALILVITLLAIFNHFTNKRNKAYGVINEDGEDEE